MGSASWMPSKWLSRSRQISSAAVERGDDVEEQGRAPFHRLQHQVGHGPDIFVTEMAGEVAVVDGENNHQADDRPKRKLRGGWFEYVTASVTNTESTMCGPRRLAVRAAVLAATSERTGRCFLVILQAGLGGAPALRSSRERLDRDGKEAPQLRRAPADPTAVHSRRL